MALPSSGTISLNQIHVEAGGSSGSLASINDSDIRGLIGKGSAVSMSFSEWYGASATPVTVNFVGRDATNTSDFPFGSQTLSSGNKIVVVCVISQQTSASTQLSSVTLGGASMTQAVNQKAVNSGGKGGNAAVFYLETTASGSTAIAGTNFGTGAGPSEYQVFEITDFVSSTPVAAVSTDNASSLSTSHAITINGNSGGGVIIAGRSYSGANSVNQSATIRTDAQSASSSFTVAKTGLSTGSVAYTVTNGSSLGSPSSAQDGLFVMAGASWR